MSSRFARNKANEIRSKYSACFDSAVDVELIADRLGVKIHEDNLDSGVSAVLVIKNAKPHIFINKKEVNRGRRRFSIAHELGHFILHHSDLHVTDDSSLQMSIKYRDSKSSTGEHLEEVEANQFAAELLMPLDIIDRYIKKAEIKVFNEDTIAVLAEFLEVSREAISIRLAKLGYV